MRRYGSLIKINRALLYPWVLLREKVKVHLAEPTEMFSILERLMAIILFWVNKYKHLDSFIYTHTKFDKQFDCIMDCHD